MFLNFFLLFISESHWYFNCRKKIIKIHPPSSFQQYCQPPAYACNRSQNPPTPAWLKTLHRPKNSPFPPLTCPFNLDLVCFIPAFYSSAKCRRFWFLNISMKWQVLCPISNICNQTKREHLVCEYILVTNWRRNALSKEAPTRQLTLAYKPTCNS